ncbi:hypothetical protein SAMN06265222_101763 [Neorhodopirellula lusitana]|uniref:Secreted protein n=1 Tax=Neorhodopirellula lusitana TaxID=445327 RepID=A0ABY1PQ90_9BACT|nr:hypothetical protein SAMN06265222_101763 [Neorhodopirellula lusitana]
MMDMISFFILWIVSILSSLKWWLRSTVTSLATCCFSIVAGTGPVPFGVKHLRAQRFQLAVYCTTRYRTTRSLTASAVWPTSAPAPLPTTLP